MGSECCKCHSEKNAHQARNTSILSTTSSNYIRRSRSGQRALANDRFRPYKSSLAIRQLTSDDAGLYSAESEDSYGTSMLASIDLNVQKRKPEVPVFLKRLNDMSVKIGSRARFLVEIENIPPLRITWYHDNQILRKSERLNFLEDDRFYCLDVGWTVLPDEGHWTCIAENKHGCSVSSAYLTILVPKAYKTPRFVEELKAILAEDGTVSLECKVIGVPTPMLHWYKDGKKITAGDTFALRANSSDSSSLGTYSCVAKNCLGQAFSSSSVHFHNEGQLSDKSAFLLGPQPKFVRELQNAETQIEAPLTLSCQVVVPPWPKTIDWYNKNGRVVENDKYKMIADGLGMYAMEIKKVEMMDEGEWKCVATSFFGIKAFTSCFITVKFPKNYKLPKFLENLRAVMTPEGLVSFECKVVGYPTPQLKWLKDGKELKPGDVYQLTGTNSLGTYCCIAKNSMGEISSTTVLTLEDIQSQLTEEERLMIFAINQPPYFVKGLSSHELEINEGFKFHVQVSAKPDPKIFWYRNDELIEKSERITILKEEHGNFFLCIKRAELKDQAEWRAVAVNDYGQSVTSCFVKLAVPKHFKGPRFLEDLKATLTKEGTVNLECKVIGIPQPELRWYKDGKCLKSGEMHRIISGTNGTCRLGMYTCEALNCMGTVTSSASLLAYEEEIHDETAKLRKSNNLDILSIITEERSSQLNNSDKSMTYEEAANVSFSFDGKEVSISLYETPDLTEEEALQIVEMYANELTDQISDQNIVELPSLRFTKETVTSGNILMEATIIDVPPNEFCVEEELKTDADVENSMMDDSALLNNNSTSFDVEKINFDFPHIHSSQHLNEVLLSKTPNENSLTDTKQTIGDSLKTSVLSLNTNIVDGISDEEKQQKITALQTPLARTIRQETLQKRVSFDSEDDSLYEFEKRKAQEKLQQSVESSSIIASTIVNCSSLLDKKNLSPLESTALSISAMELDLDKIQNDLICSKDLEKDVTNYTLNVLDSLLQPIHEIKNSLEMIENRLGEGDNEEKEIIINTLHESVQKIQCILSGLDRDENYKNNLVFCSRRQSILGIVVKPLIEIKESLNLLTMEHLKPFMLSSVEKDIDDQSDPSSNDDSVQSDSTSVISDARKMIVILNEYNKELENLDALIQQKRNSVQYDNNLLQICENLNAIVQQVKNVRDWSATMHENSSNFPLFGPEHMSDVLEYNTTVLQFLDTNINVVKAALQTSTGFNQIEKFLDDTSLVRENLETTLTLTSKLSPITTVNYLTDALKSYTSISNQFPKNKCFLQDVLAVNPDCMRSINGSIETILNSLDTIEKCCQVESLYHKKRTLLAFHRIKMPLKHLEMTLCSVEKQILNHKDGIGNMTGLQVYKLVNIISEPLQMVRKEISVILNDCQLQEYTHETTDTLLTLAVPSFRDFQDTITAFHNIVFDKEPESIDANYVLSALNNLNPPLYELASSMIKVEELILSDAPVVSDPRLGIRIVIQSISSLIKAIYCLQSNLPQNNSTVGALYQLNEPLVEVKNGFKEINDRFYREDPKKVNITMLKTLSTPFNQLQKELIKASNVLSGDIKNTIADLQRTILTIQDQVSFEYGDEPASIEYNIMTLQTLLQPLNVLRNHCVTIREDLKNETSSLADIIDSLEEKQMKIVNDIDYLLEELMKDPADQHYPPNLIRAIHSTLHFLKKYKALLTTLREPDSIQNGSLGHNVKRVLEQMHFDFDKIEQNIESEELKCELRKIVCSVINIEQAPDLLSLHTSLQSLSLLTPVFSKILLELEVLSKVDIQDVDSVECFIALLQSLNTLRTLQENVKNFHSSSNTDSIQIPMLLSFLGSCERLEIKVSELLSIVENCADQNVKLDSLFYKQAIEAFTTLNNQLIHLNKCLIDQSMSDDNQKEIPFEMSINNFMTLLGTIDADTENDLLKEVHAIINQGIIDELKRLKNDILFNMSLIQSEDEITFNESDQCEDALPGNNPDLVGVCLKSIKNEIRKCDKCFDKINGIQFKQKVANIDNINSSLENIYNILNFINRNISLEGEEKYILTLQQPVMHMLQQIHKIKVFLSMGDIEHSSVENNILPKLTNLNQSFERFKSLLASYNSAYATGTSSSEASSSKPASYAASDKILGLGADASEDMTDSIYNDLSSSTESAEYTTVKPNQIFDLSISEASAEEKSLAADSSSPSSDILSDLKVPETEPISLHIMEITDGVEISPNKTTERDMIKLDQYFDNETSTSVNNGEVINEVKELAVRNEARSTVPDEKTRLPKDQSILCDSSTPSYLSKVTNDTTATDHLSMCSMFSEEKKHLTDQIESDICELSVLEVSLAADHNIEDNYTNKQEMTEDNDLKLYSDQKEDSTAHLLLEVKTALLQDSSALGGSQGDHSIFKVVNNNDTTETNSYKTTTVSQMLDMVEDSLSVSQYLKGDNTITKNTQELDTLALISSKTGENEIQKKSTVAYEQCSPRNKVQDFEADTSYLVDQEYEKLSISNETNFDIGKEPTTSIQTVEKLESTISGSIVANLVTLKTTKDSIPEYGQKTIEESNKKNVEGFSSYEIQGAIQKAVDSTELAVGIKDIQAEPELIPENDETLESRLEKEIVEITLNNTWENTEFEITSNKKEKGGVSGIEIKNLNSKIESIDDIQSQNTTEEEDKFQEIEIEMNNTETSNQVLIVKSDADLKNVAEQETETNVEELVSKNGSIKTVEYLQTPFVRDETPQMNQEIKEDDIEIIEEAGITSGKLEKITDTKNFEAEGRNNIQELKIVQGEIPQVDMIETKLGLQKSDIVYTNQDIEAEIINIVNIQNPRSAIITGNDQERTIQNIQIINQNIGKGDEVTGIGLEVEISELEDDAPTTETLCNKVTTTAVDKTKELESVANSKEQVIDRSLEKNVQGVEEYQNIVVQRSEKHTEEEKCIVEAERIEDIQESEFAVNDRGLVKKDVELIENLEMVNENLQPELELEKARIDKIMKLEIEDQSNIEDSKSVNVKIELHVPELDLMIDAPSVRVPKNSLEHNIAEDEKLEIMEEELMDIEKPVEIEITVLLEKENKNIEIIQQAIKELYPEEKRQSLDIELEKFPQPQTSQQKSEISIGNEPGSDETSKEDLSLPIPLFIEKEKNLIPENLNDRKIEEDRTLYNTVELENQEENKLNKNQEVGSTQTLERNTINKTSSTDLINESSPESIEIEDNEVKTLQEMVNSATKDTILSQKFGIINSIKSEDLEIAVPVAESKASQNIEENPLIADPSEENDPLNFKLIEKIPIEFQEPMKPKLGQRTTSLVREDTVEEYWDSKDDDCSLECSKTHKHPNLLSSLSDSCSQQESFETAVDDLENSECDELVDLENTFTDKDDLNENLQLVKTVFPLDEEKVHKKLVLKTDLKKQSTEDLELTEEINSKLSEGILTSGVKAEKLKEVEFDTSLQTPQVREAEFLFVIVNEDPEIEESDLHQHNPTSENIESPCVTDPNFLEKGHLEENFKHYHMLQPTENGEEPVKDEIEIKIQINKQDPQVVEESQSKGSVEEQRDIEENEVSIRHEDREDSQSNKSVEEEVSPENLDMMVQNFPIDTYKHTIGDCPQLKVGIEGESTVECKIFPELITTNIYAEKILQPIEDERREMVLQKHNVENETFEKDQILDLEIRECLLLDDNMEKESNIDSVELEITALDSSNKTLNTGIENKAGVKNMAKCEIKSESFTKEVEKLDGSDSLVMLETREGQESVVQKTRLSFEESLQQNKDAKEEILKIETPGTRVQHYVQECSNSGTNMAICISEKGEHEIRNTNLVAQGVEVCLETNKDADKVTKYVDQHSKLQKEEDESILKKVELESLTPNSAVKYLESSTQLKTDEQTRLTAKISRIDSGNSQLDDNIEQNLLAEKIDSATKTSEINQDLRGKSPGPQEKLVLENIDLKNKILDVDSQRLMEDCLKPSSVNFKLAIEKIEVIIETPEINVENCTVEECSQAKKGVKEDSMIKKCELELGIINSAIEFIDVKEVDLPQRAYSEEMEIETMIQENEDSQKTEDAQEFQTTKMGEDKISCRPVPKQNIQILEEEHEVMEITRSGMEDNEKAEQLCIEECRSILEEIDKLNRNNLDDKELEDLCNSENLGPTKNQGISENENLADVEQFKEGEIEERVEKNVTKLVSENQCMKQNQGKYNNAKMRKGSNQNIISVIPPNIEDPIDTLLESNKERRLSREELHLPENIEEIKIENQQELMERSEKSVVQEIMPRVNEENEFRKSKKDNQSRSIFIDSDELNPKEGNLEGRLEVGRIEVELCIPNTILMTEPKNMSHDTDSKSKEENKLEPLHSMEKRLSTTNSTEDRILNDLVTNELVISQSKEITRQKGPEPKEQKIKEDCYCESNERKQDTEQKSDEILEDLSKPIKKYNLIEKQLPEEITEVKQRDIEMLEGSNIIEELDVQMRPVKKINDFIKDKMKKESKEITKLRESEQEDQKQEENHDSEFKGKNLNAKEESVEILEDSSGSFKNIKSIETRSQDETKEIECKEVQRTQEESERIDELDAKKFLMTKAEEFIEEKIKFEDGTDRLVILESNDVTKRRQTDQEGQEQREYCGSESEEGNQDAKPESDKILEDGSKPVEKSKPVKKKLKEQTAEVEPREAHEIQENSQIKEKLIAEERPMTEIENCAEAEVENEDEHRTVEVGQREAEEIQENSQIEEKLTAEECPVTKIEESTEGEDEIENEGEPNEVVDLKSKEVTKLREQEQGDQKQRKNHDFDSEEGNQDAKQESDKILEDWSKPIEKCELIKKKSEEETAEVEKREAEEIQENSQIKEELSAKECPMTKIEESTEGEDKIENEGEPNEIVDLKSEDVTKLRDQEQKKSLDLESEEGNQDAKQESDKILEDWSESVEKSKPVKKKSEEVTAEVEQKYAEEVQENSQIKEDLIAEDCPMTKTENCTEAEVEQRNGEVVQEESQIKEELSAKEYPKTRTEESTEGKDEIGNDGELHELTVVNLKSKEVTKPRKLEQEDQKQKKNHNIESKEGNQDGKEGSNEIIKKSSKPVEKCKSIEKLSQKQFTRVEQREAEEIQKNSQIGEELSIEECPLTKTENCFEDEVENEDEHESLVPKPEVVAKLQKVENQKQRKSNGCKLKQKNQDAKEESDKYLGDSPKSITKCESMRKKSPKEIMQAALKETEKVLKGSKFMEVSDVQECSITKPKESAKKEIEIGEVTNGLVILESKEVTKLREEEQEDQKQNKSQDFKLKEEKQDARRESFKFIKKSKMIERKLYNQTEADEEGQIENLRFKPSNVQMYPKPMPNQNADYQLEYYRYSPKYYHHIVRDQNDNQQMKTSSSSSNDRLTHVLQSNFKDTPIQTTPLSNSDSNTHHSYLECRRYSEIPEVKISQADMLHDHFSRLGDQTTRFLYPDCYSSRASSIDRSSRASSASRDNSNDSLYLSTNGRQRYLSASTNDDFFADYRPVSAPPNLIHDAYMQTDLYSRPNSPLYKPSTYTKLYFRDDIYLDYEYLRGNNRKEFKYIPKSYLPRHHMYLHSNCNYLDSSSFSFEFYHPRCPYCRILYLRYQANNWSDYLWPKRNYFQKGSRSSDISYSSALKAYRYQIFDDDTLNYIHSKSAKIFNIGPKWASCSDIKTIIPSQTNRCVYRSKEAEDFVKKHFWDDKHPTRVYFSDSAPIYRPRSFQGINSIESHIPSIKYSLGLSPRFKQLCVEDTVPLGATITFHAEEEGTPKPNIKWLKEEKTLQSTPLRLQYIEDTDFHTLIISDVSHSDVGRYRCKLWNKYGVADAYTSINVVTTDRGKPPRFITRPETIMCIICGSDLSVSFRLSGDPKPRVLWMKGLTDITETHRSLKETINDYVRLTLKRAQISDAGTYFIIAKNKYGTDRAFFTLQVDQRLRSLTPLPFYKHVMDVRKSSVLHASNTSNLYHSKLSHYNNYQSSRLRNHINSIRLRLIHSRSCFLINRAFV